MPAKLASISTSWRLPVAGDQDSPADVKTKWVWQPAGTQPLAMLQPCWVAVIFSPVLAV